MGGGGREVVLGSTRTALKPPAVALGSDDEAAGQARSNEQRKPRQRAVGFHFVRISRHLSGEALSYFALMLTFQPAARHLVSGSLQAVMFSALFCCFAVRFVLRVLGTRGGGVFRGVFGCGLHSYTSPIDGMGWPGRRLPFATLGLHEAAGCCSPADRHLFYCARYGARACTNQPRAAPASDQNHDKCLLRA